MGLQFYFGASGAGKSRQLHKDIVRWAGREPERNFLFLVPDQFTMQTQVDLVNASDCGGIMNIDVLSFGRLSHRIFEETGYGSKPVLDDTGKSLVLRKVAASLQEQMPVIGKNPGGEVRHLGIYAVWHQRFTGGRALRVCKGAGGFAL